MLIIRFLRYIFGYINFRAYGGFADRFLNLCTREGVPLWNIKNIDGRITAETTAKGYLMLRRPARMAGMRVRAVEKKGIYFFLRAHRRRVGMLAGAVVAVALIAVLSQFVWSVSVVGNVSLEEEYILSAFEKYGAYVGAPLSSVKGREAAQQALTELPELAWAAVNRKGTALVIEVRERTRAPEIYDSKTPTNVIAAEDGVVLGVDILYGRAEVKAGSAVTKGDLLISGIMTHADMSESMIHADGRVRAATQKRGEFSSEDFLMFKLAVSKTRRKLFFFGIKIPLGGKVPEAYSTEHSSFLSSGEKLMPLGIITEHGMEFSAEPAVKERQTENRLALFSEAMYLKNLLEYCDVKSSKIALKNSEFGKKYEFYAECEQEIGRLQEIYIEKTNDIA